MSDDLWRALALMLVIEGVMPFLSPLGFRRRLIQLVQMPERSLRLLGLGCMSLGVVLLYLLK
jgi:uncharacterized protein YjeT (DUF2065 family)